MKIIKINPKNPEERKIDYIVKFLKENKAVVLPTDTSYALSVNALNKGAVERVYKIKKRPKRSPLSIIVRNIKMAGKYAKIDYRTKKLFNKITSR